MQKALILIVGLCLGSLQCAASPSRPSNDPGEKERIAMSKTASPSSPEDFRVAQLKLTYVGPQEKPVPTLIAFSSAFRLTAEALRLLSTRIPIEVARRLQRVPDLEFLSRASFRAACMFW